MYSRAGRSKEATSVTPILIFGRRSLNGLTKLGLDPADIRYVIVSHGHYDHAGGAKLLQERFGARVLMSAADWDMLERDKPAWLPRRDIEVTDGQKLTVGDTTLEIFNVRKRRNPIAA